MVWQKKSAPFPSPNPLAPLCLLAPNRIRVIQFLCLLPPASHAGISRPLCPLPPHLMRHPVLLYLLLPHLMRHLAPLCPLPPASHAAPCPSLSISPESYSGHLVSLSISSASHAAPCPSLSITSHIPCGHLFDTILCYFLSLLTLSVKSLSKLCHFIFFICTVRIFFVPLRSNPMLEGNIFCKKCFASALWGRFLAY